jgi:parallel beta-helix repeat protein
MRNLRDYLTASPQQHSLIAKNRLTKIISLEARQLLAALSFNASSFKSGYKKIKSGDTVTLSGRIKVTSAQKSSLEKAKNLKGSATLDFSSSSSVQMLNFSGKRGGSVNGLKFINAGIDVKSSPNFKITNNTFSGYTGKRWSNDKKLVRLANGSHNGTISGNKVTWNNTSVNLNAYSSKSSNGVRISNNQATGRLEQGIVMNGTTGGTISGNRVTRASGTPGTGAGGNVARGEDHGIYVLNASNVNVTSNTTKGWSTRASGAGLKIKDAQKITVTGNNFASGVIGRVGKKNLLKNITIKNNTLNGWGVSIYTKGKARNITISGNRGNGKVVSDAK